VDSSPAIVSGAKDGILFIGSGDGKLYAMGTLYPDLIVNNISISSNVKDGQIVRINATIENQGEGDAEFKVSFYYDQTAPAYLIGALSGSITHFTEKNLSMDWDTSGKTGNHTIYVVADVTSGVADENESNNLRNKTIEIEASDRSLRVMPHYKRVRLGDNFTISLNISSDVNVSRVEFNLIFNSSVLDLNLTNIKEGNFFTNYSYSMTDNNTLNFTFNTKYTGSSILNLTNVTVYDTGSPISDVLTVDGEVDTCLMGDADCICKNSLYEVDIDDLMLVAQAFHTKLGDGTYDARADLKPDNVINIFDLAIVGKYFGSSHIC
jgi:hypothetical protein